MAHFVSSARDSWLLAGLPPSLSPYPPGCLGTQPGPRSHWPGYKIQLRSHSALPKASDMAGWWLTLQHPPQPEKNKNPSNNHRLRTYLYVSLCVLVPPLFPSGWLRDPVKLQGCVSRLKIAGWTRHVTAKTPCWLVASLVPGRGMSHVVVIA